jgi:hypothetical protein
MMIVLQSADLFSLNTHKVSSKRCAVIERDLHRNSFMVLKESYNFLPKVCAYLYARIIENS